MFEFTHLYNGTFLSDYRFSLAGASLPQLAQFGSLRVSAGNVLGNVGLATRVWLAEASV